MRTSLLDRDDERQALIGAVQDARDGRGTLVVVEGPAGAGKSALLAHTGAEAREAGTRVLPARGGVLEAEQPFGVARQLFEPALMRITAAERARLLTGAASPAEAVLGLSAAEVGDPLTALHALFWLTASLASREPLALVVDDAHWADASSLRALDFLVRRLADLPVAIVVALRPAEPGARADLLDEVVTAPGAVRLRLAPLREASVAQLVRARRPDAGAAACRAAHEATAGNPFLVDELVRSLDGHDLAGEAAAETIRRTAVASVGDRVLRRIARIGPQAGPLARALAVLGDGASLTTAATLAGVPVAAADEAAHHLRRIEVLAAEDPIGFSHPLVRTSLYDAIPTAQRDALHVEAAQLLNAAGAPPEVVVAHLILRRPSGSVAVAGTLLEAAERSLARGAPDEAIRCLDRALEEQAPEPPRGALLGLLGATEVAVRGPRATEHLEAALAEPAPPGVHARLAGMLATNLFLEGDGEGAVATATAARARLGDADRALAAELAALELMVSSYAAAPEALPASSATEHLEPFVDPSTPGGAALAAMLAAMAAHRGEPATVVRSFVERGLAEGRLFDREAVQHNWAPAHIMVALIEIDDIDGALEVGRRLRAASRRHGSLNGEWVTAAHRAWALARRGELAEAEAEVRFPLAMSSEPGGTGALIPTLFYVQDVLLERPSAEDVAAIALALETGPLAGTYLGAMLLLTRGRLRLLAHDPRGVADLREAVRITRGARMGPSVAPARSALALALPADERGLAHELVDEELALARASGLARPAGVALRAAGLLADDARERVRLLQESRDALTGTAAGLEQARTLHALGGALRRAQQRAAARPVLAEAAELARACGATRLLERTLEELRAAGGRPRRIALSGPGALTPSEQRVARLAADGMTNPEIAQDLFLTVKTVETHLSAAYRKLGLSGQGARERLGAALAVGHQGGEFPVPPP